MTVAACEETEDHAGDDLAAEDVERPLRLAQRNGEAQQRIQRDKKDDGQCDTDDDECGEKDTQSRGLYFPGILQLSTIVVNRHLHIGEGLQAVVEGAEVGDGCTKREPLAVEIYTVGMEKRRWQQELRKHCDQLPGVLGGE
jgi:hypothetical protein